MRAWPVRAAATTPIGASSNIHMTSTAGRDGDDLDIRLTRHRLRVPLVLSGSGGDIQRTVAPGLDRSDRCGRTPELVRASGAYSARPGRFAQQQSDLPQRSTTTPRSTRQPQSAQRISITVQGSGSYALLRPTDGGGQYDSRMRRKISLVAISSILLLAIGTRVADALGVGGPRLRCACD